jgi:hydrogenase maturation protein HypF
MVEASLHSAKTRQRLHVTGIVQGVGFRPFVYSLASQLDLAGWVSNTSSGVIIEVEGESQSLDQFQSKLITQAPPLAHIEKVEAQELPPDGFTHFEIRASQVEPGAFQPISPDIATCDDCLREMNDPRDRRYRYPFTNCTNCGPRFTIIKDIPYDRPETTMAAFPMCPDCAREYHDPLDRRFHAQPVACPDCGPQVWLVLSHSQTSDREVKLAVERPEPGPDGRLMYPLGEDAIHITLELLSQGKIVGIKGLGGFHLACDATNPQAVADLRSRKGRREKPFALMMADEEQVASYCRLSPRERELLLSRERPIVLLWRKEGAAPAIVEAVAPNQDILGVMLPYTPLHHLLFPPGRANPLVMTSGNFSEEPIATTNHEALTRLAPLADAFLVHDRDIHIRTDDSVVRIYQGQELPVRRSRGYAPYPVHLPVETPQVLAVGAELKNTFCLTRENYAFMSQHIGDMENYETLCSFEDGVAHFEKLFRVEPQFIAYDLHPDYMATRYALERADKESLPAIGVQHHHAHIAACLADNGYDGAEPVIGVSFDGTGYGPDGAVWGGEFLIADYTKYTRPFHLDYLPLPGGDAATRVPARTALAYLLHSGIEDMESLPPTIYLSPQERAIVEKQYRTGLNSPLTSSMGRLFDAVASLVGVRQAVNYEAQAAIELEAIADPEERGAYSFQILAGRISAAPVIQSIITDYRTGLPADKIAARFHNGVAAMIRSVCLQMRRDGGLEQVALSGGVFQNVILLQRTTELLADSGFTILIHHQVPPNDGGLALGQALIAGRQSI